MNTQKSLLITNLNGSSYSTKFTLPYFSVDILVVGRKFT